MSGVLDRGNGIAELARMRPQSGVFVCNIFGIGWVDVGKVRYEVVKSCRESQGLILRLGKPCFRPRFKRRLNPFGA